MSQWDSRISLLIRDCVCVYRHVVMEKADAYARVACVKWPTKRTECTYCH